SHHAGAAANLEDANGFADRLEMGGHERSPRLKAFEESVVRGREADALRLVGDLGEQTLEELLTFVDRIDVENDGPTDDPTRAAVDDGTHDLGEHHSAVDGRQEGDALAIRDR